jgi:hypothetical protein
MINKKLAKKINLMAVIDQRMRKRAIKNSLWDKKIDKHNTKILKKIVKKYGWPTINLVGKKASFNSWLLTQHADHDLRFQKKALQLIKRSFEENPKNIDKKNIAFLTDRILVHEKKNQLFGTQFHVNKNGRLSPRPIKDNKNLDRRRGKYDLPPFRQYEKAMKKYRQAKIK